MAENLRGVVRSVDTAGVRVELPTETGRYVTEKLQRTVGTVVVVGDRVLVARVGGPNSPDLVVVGVLAAAPADHPHLSDRLVLPNLTAAPATPAAGGVVYAAAGVLRYVGQGGTNTAVAPS